MPDGNPACVEAAADSPTGDAAPVRVLALGVNWFDAGSGGLDRVFHDLALHLPAAGIALQGLVLGPPDAAARSQGRVAAFGRPGAVLPERLWRARRRIAGALRGRHGAAPDLLAAHFALFAFPALDLLRTRPLVVHFHGPWAAEAGAEGAGVAGQALRWRIEHAVYGRAARLITLSAAFADLLVLRYAVPAARVRVVPGSVALERFAPRQSRAAARADAVTQLGWPAKGPVLLAVRRLVRRMGLDQLIAAMAPILGARPDAHLVIAGHGPEEAALRTLASAHGADGRIHFQGFIADALLPLAYRAADLNLVPSRALEGFGLTAAEALASGTPSLVAPVGGLPEVVTPLSPSLVMADGGAAAIADAVVRALGGAVPDDAACIAYAAARFSPARAARAVAAVYRDAAAGATS